MTARDVRNAGRATPERSAAVQHLMSQFRPCLAERMSASALRAALIVAVAFLLAAVGAPGRPAQHAAAGDTRLVRPPLRGDEPDRVRRRVRLRGPDAAGPRPDALRHAYRGTALLLGDVVEADDAYTGVHSRDVVDLCLAVGPRHGLDGDQLRRLEFTALLHDVGKIAIPKEIINKPGKLTDEERAVIETHTIEGETMLARRWPAR
jgi:HD-GYP domain-containing protein (c-di-GMP phosphodiesterase class II)